VAALVAVLLVLPATVPAADGGAGANRGGGATYYDTGATQGAISLKVASGAWVGRPTRIRGRSEQLAGHTVSIQGRRSRRAGWGPLVSARVANDGTFAARWTPGAAGRRELRAVDADASSAGSDGARAASPPAAVTVYRRVTASWYGPGFYGHRTACGRRLTTRTLGVAHRTLPCGAKVAIRVGGRSLVIPVIDRGPYAPGVTYDLTGAAARRLGVAETRRIGAAVMSR
jgi:hypothetical protein